MNGTSTETDHEQFNKASRLLFTQTEGLIQSPDDNSSTSTQLEQSNDTELSLLTVDQRSTGRVHGKGNVSSTHTAIPLLAYKVGETSILGTEISLHDVQFKARTHPWVSVRGGRVHQCCKGYFGMFFFTNTGRVHITIYDGERDRRSAMNQYNPLGDIYDRDPHTPNHIQFSVEYMQLRDSVLDYLAPLQCKQDISLSLCCPRVPHQVHTLLFIHPHSNNCNHSIKRLLTGENHPDSLFLLLFILSQVLTGPHSNPQGKFPTPVSNRSFGVVMATDAHTGLGPVLHSKCPSGNTASTGISSIYHLSHRDTHYRNWPPDQNGFVPGTHSSKSSHPRASVRLT
ncbi:uncharacterized protein LOC130432605 [Triplophysa dalaica]|uniref:uncharacterized protein LOC130432605 n=1 Tax=Triplophysa dalaica TaxID=1582913 RepID=UPI0024DFB5F8|nr:uncharacterized protein LOC130432605 [Triplophysa dalaica]XP_056618031.1 uncharacterized protein LOC130432605 [Triplophysa dalaica]XP_056618032.1 uncharacterized protein LOC130432605 [Triplophysa dalaica]